MADRALAYLIIGNVWLATAVIIRPGQYAFQVTLVGGHIWLGIFLLTGNRQRRREESRRNLDRDEAAARYREAMRHVR